MNSTNEKENSALVPKQPSAVEKAEPGAKRILASIVAETLSLARATTSSHSPPQVLQKNKAELEELNRKGNAYYDGIGVSQDYAEAVKWYRLAAEMGFAPAQFNLAYCYHHGKSVAEDYFGQAKEWYLKAALQGHALAQCAYYMYSHDSRVPNREDAARWLKESAGQGHSFAQLMLGLMCENGKGLVPQDQAQAVTWYHKAAEQGFACTENVNLRYCCSHSPSSMWESDADIFQALAQWRLGCFYRDGTLVPKDEVEAYKWFKLAAGRRAEWISDFNSVNGKELTSLRAKLSPTELAEGDRRCEEFKRRFTSKEQPQQPRPLRIVVVDDEDGLLKMVELLIHDWFNEVTVLTFQNPDAAWRELSLGDPDLLITRDRMPALTGQEICQRLMGRKAAYPIIVTGGWPPTEQWVREYRSQGLNITFLRSPFSTEQFNLALLEFLGPSDNPHSQLRKGEQ